MQGVYSIGPREMSSSDVWKEILIKREALRKRLDERYSRVLEQALLIESGLRGGPQDEAWNRRANTLAAFARELESASAVKRDRSLMLYLLEFYKKFSIPFGALSFVFLAVPLGLLAKKSGQTVGFIFGLIISFLYWALLLGGQTMGMRLGYSPFWSIWLPNILAVSIGGVMCIVRLRR
jgi:lipopolysaccharide export system permease protein